MTAIETDDQLDAVDPVSMPTIDAVSNTVPVPQGGAADSSRSRKVAERRRQSVRQGSGEVVPPTVGPPQGSTASSRSPTR